MPREPKSRDARHADAPRKTPKQPRQRQPPASVEATIEKHVHYCVLGEIASQWLRNRYPGGRFRVVEDMWDDVKAEWYRDPVNLSVQPTKGDEASYVDFWRKCEILCNERTPKDARDHIKLFLSAGTAISFIVAKEICTKPRWKAYICRESTKRQLKIMSLHPSYDGYLRPQTTGAVDLYGLIGQTIHCTDGSSFTMVDNGTSVLCGDWFLVRDAAGKSQTLSWDEMEALVQRRVRVDV
ncbi:hypothetical protein PLICRDRAFT_173074 [Plicaturopsis crispa FD-325 SS-3]|nr:hypothetical protein PLICRDRAFT_173074 [Plicaturopsis crispa FD-325 SS-3]